ncbi:MAG: shikimate kinase [Pleurocapsa sp. SU_196_0]|nr:shikimate kinase [Pleurocapsa sp. SU_196_0]
MPATGEPIELDRPVSWVALVGFMGTGKSRIGWELSRALALHFVDTDKVIERVAGLTIQQIFEVYDEATFRSFESEVVERCVALDQAVVSTGGGTFTRDENRRTLLSRGPVIALRASPETILERTRKHPRVLLQVPDPLGKINELLAVRKPFYDLAPIQVSTDGRLRRDVVAEIIARLEAWRDDEPFDFDAWQWEYQRWQNSTSN